MAAVPPPAPIDDRDLLAQKLEELMESADDLSMGMISEVIEKASEEAQHSPAGASLLDKEDQRIVDELEARDNRSVEVAMEKGELRTHEVVHSATTCG